MIWTIKQITESDYGCEERMPGEPLMVLVVLESEDGQECRFEAADNWLTIQGLDEGDEWPEDLDGPDPEHEKISRMDAWMDHYYDALEEL